MKNKELQNKINKVKEHLDWLSVDLIEQLIIEVEGLEASEEALKSQTYNKEANC